MRHRSPVRTNQCLSLCILALLQFRKRAESTRSERIVTDIALTKELSLAEGTSSPLLHTVAVAMTAGPGTLAVCAVEAPQPWQRNSVHRFKNISSLPVLQTLQVQVLTPPQLAYHGKMISHCRGRFFSSANNHCSCIVLRGTCLAFAPRSRIVHGVPQNKAGSIRICHCPLSLKTPSPEHDRAGESHSRTKLRPDSAQGPYTDVDDTCVLF